MDMLTNLQALTQTRFDSGALSGLGAVVHRLTTPGEHRLTMLQAGNPIQSVPLQVVSPPSPDPAAVGVSIPNTVHVDLGGILAPTGELAPRPPSAPLRVAVQGYAMFSAPANTSEVAVQIRPPGSENQPPVFDSRELGEGDVFAVTPLRPGRYSLANTATGAKGEIRVAYPVIGTTPYQPPDPVTVQVTEQGFQPNVIQLKPAQGLVFQVDKMRGRIQIDLVEPDDGPKQGSALLHRWVKPTPPPS
jgi:hypothetical protein